jgi:DHA1 family multidrug resistance protein-like MFS transporter
VFAVRIILRLGDRTLSPIMPLFVQSLLPVGAKVASTTGLIMGASAATSACGAVLLGRASDRVGYRPVLLLCSFAAAGLYVPLYFVTDATQLLICQTLTGFFLGGTITSLSAMLASLAPEGRQGAVYGVDASAVSFAQSVGPMLGATAAIAFGLRPSFLFAAGVFFLGGLLVARLVPAKRG